MPHAPSRKRKKPPKRVLALPDLEHAKGTVLASLASASGQRTYDHAIGELVAWYCSAPRLALSRTVVLRYRIHFEQRGISQRLRRQTPALGRQERVHDATVARQRLRAGATYLALRRVRHRQDFVRSARGRQTQERSSRLRHEHDRSVRRPGRPTAEPHVAGDHLWLPCAFPRDL
jgi:hypothetical protein